MKKKVLLWLFLAVCLTPAVAQFSAEYGGEQKKMFGAFLKSTTYVVLNEPDSGYNEVLRSAVQKQWKMTKFEFIDETQYKQMEDDETKSFLYGKEGPVKVVSYNDKGGISHTQKWCYLELNLLVGRKKKSKFFDGQIPYSHALSKVYLRYEDTFDHRVKDTIKDRSYQFQMENFLIAMQNHLKAMQAQNFVITKVLNGMNKEGAKVIYSKTLYLLKSSLMKSHTEEKIKEFYDGPFKIVDEKELKKIIEERRKDAVYMHGVGLPTGEDEGGSTGASYHNTFYLAETGEALYYEKKFFTNARGFLKDTAKDIIKASKKK